MLTNRELEQLDHLAMLAMAFGRVNRATLHPDGKTPESDTDHTVMLGWTALALLTMPDFSHLRPGKVAIYSLIHDAVEVYAGDTDTTGGLTDEQRQDKEQRETVALERLTSELTLLPGFLKHIEDYEAQADDEAHFVRYLDKVLPKITHRHNHAVGMSYTKVGDLRHAHDTQNRSLKQQHPMLADSLGEIFDHFAGLAEVALETRLHFTSKED